MDLKKIVAIAVLLLATACSERDKEYYQANIDNAEAKANECEQSMMTAFEKEDEKKIEALSKDSECNFATEVYRDHKRKLAKLERQAKKRAQAKQREEDEKIYQQQYAEKLIALKALPYADFFSFQKDCSARLLGKKTPECQAFSDLKADVETREIDVLKAKYVDGALEEFRDSSCKGVNYGDVICMLSTKAARLQSEERIEHYLSNRDELKVDFNKCHANYDALRKANKWKLANESLRTYQCNVVGKAARKLKVYSFDKPIG